MNKISVITPSLNSSQFVQRAIDSVLHQNYVHVEHIVIDGGSTDGTVEILQQNPHIKWISEPDSGQSNAMNKGFKMSTGDIVVYLNADDYFLPDVFTEVVSAFQNGAQIVFGNLEIHSASNSVEVRKPSTDYRKILAHWNGVFPINPVQYFYTRPLQQNLLFNENNHWAMDHEFLLEICKDRNIVHIDKTFGVFQMHEGSKTVRGFASPLNYWTTDTFGYIDKYLLDLPADFICSFKNSQHDFYRQKVGEHLQREGFRGSARLVSYLQDKCNIIVYGAGTYTESILDLITDRISYIVDQNWTYIHSLRNLQVYSPDTLRNEKSPLVLVTTPRYREQISLTIRAHCPDATIVFLDEITKVDSL